MRKALISILCVFILAGCSVSSDDGWTNDKDDPIPEDVIDVPDPNVIIDTFYNNELDGNRQYLYKWVRTTALFDEIDRSWLDDLWVYFDVKKPNGYYAKYGVLCNEMSEKEQDKIHNFDKGKPVVLIGKIDGLLAGSRIEFNKCQFPEY